MATNKTTGNDRTTKAKSSRPSDTSLPARTARTVKERPYTSAAIAGGAIAAVAAVAAGAVLVSRREKSLRETGEDLSTKLKEGFADASAKVREIVGGEEAKTQQQIAEEALTLKESGAGKGGVDSLSSDEIKTGAISY